MSPRKLTDHDKEELLVAYRETAETTSTLAARYGVSSSTVSRLLKSRLSATEYEELIQQKRRGGSAQVEKSATPKGKSTPKVVEKPKPITRTTDPDPAVILTSPQPVTLTEELALEGFADEFDEADYDLPPIVSEAGADQDFDEQAGDYEEDFVTAEFDDDGEDYEEDFEEDGVLDETAINPELLALAQEIQLGDRQQALKELLGDDISDEDDFDDDEDFDDEDDDDDEELDLTPVPHSETVEIFPLEAAKFPRTCYVVTDRLSELIARPMGEFQDLGHIPAEEVTKKTLPVFDNHRVAKRFIRGRTQKIIKIPNGELFFKTSGCLTAKGITRLLLDGKVYQLS
jgi:hypothetical protein